MITLHVAHEYYADGQATANAEPKHSPSYPPNQEAWRFGCFYQIKTIHPFVKRFAVRRNDEKCNL